LNKRAKGIADQLKEELNLLSDLGVEFVFASEKNETQKEAVLFPLQEKILRCTLCPLAEGRKNAVPGEGDFDAALMFVGEAPGADEDIQGRPFVGRAGQLLTKIIAAMKFRRDEAYITNVVKCRPPHNRTPVREEIEKCKPYLLKQIEIIQPDVIVSLGKVATDFFIPSGATMSSLRGHFHQFGGIPVMPTFHPSYIIRNEDDKKIKRLVWDDMQKVMAVLGKK
jgi:uracil-DNA glycosylase family 4